MVVPPIDPASPEWFKRWAVQLQQEFSKPANGPDRLYAQPSVNLPPASKWQGAVMYDTTLGSVVYSDGATWNAL